MVIRFHLKREQTFSGAILLSILLHLLFFLLYSRGSVLVPLRSLSAGPGPDDRRIAFEIVETPEDAVTETPDPNTNLLSDKNAIARDNNASSEGELPYNQGVGDAKALPDAAAEAVSGPAESSSRESQEAQEQRQVTEYAYMPAYQGSGERFSRELLLGQRSAARRQDTPGYRQEEASAQDVGGLSFNTYAWEYAPYLLELKRRIEKNIYPPPAFTRLGFEGTNMLRFRIYPDGRMENLEVLDSQGERALVETSRKAVMVSAPFNPLPSNFPEAFLEVTGKFQYFIINR